MEATTDEGANGLVAEYSFAYRTILICSGFAALLSTLLSLGMFVSHWSNWNQPSRQTQSLIIVAMAPLFAIDSFVGLLELEKGELVAHLLDIVKECYEAVCLNAFLGLMYELVGLSQDVVAGKKSLPDGIKGRELHVPFPLGALYQQNGHHPHFDQVWLKRLRLWTGQFVIFRPLLSIIDLIFVDLIPGRMTGMIKIFVMAGLNMSVTTAFFALLTFYHAFETELKPFRPLAKLLSIKGVVFFATWQGVVLKVLAHLGVLHEGHRFSIDEIELAYQDLLVCLEMGLIFSPLAIYAFQPPRKNTQKEEVEMTEKKTK